jgi:hypothetical protein
MATVITAKILNVGTRRVLRNLKSDASYFYGFASIGGKSVKVKKGKGKGNKPWTVA